jgi:hypothetical protein
MAFTEVVGFCHVLVLLSILIFVTQDMEWDQLSLEAVSSSRLAHMTPWSMGVYRAVCASIVWGALIYITFTRKPLFLTVAMRDGKKRMVSLLGTQRYAMFTVWCWTFQVRISKTHL